MTISGNATTAEGLPADFVRIFSWPTSELVGVAVPDESGDWSHEVPLTGEYGLTYIAAGCQPITHGPYLIEGSGDPHWDNVVALLHFDGDLTDETGRVWSAISSPTFESGEGVGGSDALVGAVSTEFSADLNLLNSDFTVEFFVKANGWTTWVATSTGNPPIAFGNMAHNTFSNHWSFGPISSGRLAFFAYNNNSPIYLTTTGVVPLGELTHVALMRHGDQILMSIGGTVEVVGSVGEIVLGTTNPFTVGRHSNVTRVGWQDELRITKGVARYTEDFIPQPRPFPNYGPA